MSALGSCLRGISLLAVGIVIGTVMMIYQRTGELKTGLKLNHVGIAVKERLRTIRELWIFILK